MARILAGLLRGTRRFVPERMRWVNFLCVQVGILEAHELTGLLEMPVRDLLECLGEGGDDDVGFAAAEAFDELFGGLVGIVGGVPEADDDAVVRQMRTDALADGAGLGEGEGREGRDEDDGGGLGGEGVEDLACDGGGGEEEGGVRGALHELAEHEGGEFVGLIADGDADDGEVVFGLA